MHHLCPLVLLIFLFSSCQDAPESARSEVTPTSEGVEIEPSPSANKSAIAETRSALPEVSVPSGYTLLDAATGDLDKDGKAEKVIVYDTPRETDMGTERVIRIYRQQDDAWQLWHESTGAVLASEHGGMLGDPFEGIVIENGSIVINHFGGSRQRWKYTHRFRYQQEDWQLIGATVTAGAPCEYWETLDYNLSTGNAVYEKQTETCNDAAEATLVDNLTKEFRRKADQLPRMDGFYPGATEVNIPDTKQTIYF